jgi:hypothetical protein
VIPADGGGSAGAPGGEQTLRVEPASIPGARDAFAAAAEEIKALVTQLSGLIVPAWAADPVSKETAQQFQEGNGDMGTQAAIDALNKYNEQLQNSADSLHAAYTRYVDVEGANTAKWKGQPLEA